MSYTRQAPVAMTMNDTMFGDIETVPQFETISQAPEELQALFCHKFSREIEQERLNHDVDVMAENIVWQNNAGLHAEFGKIVCATLGRLAADGIFYVITLSGEEEEILMAIGRQIVRLNPVRICGHYAKEFDFPFIMRRCMIKGIAVPAIINSAGKKTWDLAQDDTMEMWKGSQWKHYISLALLAYLMKVPSPKAEMDGKDVARVFFTEGADGLKKIEAYNQRDVITCARVFAKMKSYADIEDASIKIM